MSYLRIQVPVLRTARKAYRQHPAASCRSLVFRRTSPSEWGGFDGNHHVHHAHQMFLDDLRQRHVIGVSMPDAVGNYVFSIQAEPFHREMRYHWMICSSQNPDQLVSWGHSSTRELAEAAARNEIQDLSTGLTQGGRVTDTKKQIIRRR